MLRLKLFGGLSLEGPEGIVGGRAAQKRRLALLALLATAPGRVASRDKLIGMLWPESDGEQARHLLSVALYEMRKGLGEELLVARGDDIAIGPGVGSADLWDFEAALASADPEAAIAVYSGPFLDGFYVGDSAEFERWMEAERQRLEQRFGDALEALAEQSARRGDVRGAVIALRRRAAQDPHNSRVAKRLMEALALAGDRAGALQHARIHATLLREDFGMEPDPEIAALEARLREEPGPAAPPRTAEAAPSVQEEAEEREVATTEADSDKPAVLAPRRAVRADRIRRVPRRRRGSRWHRELLLAPLLLLSAVLLALHFREPTSARGGEIGPTTAIAVLPFEDFSPDRSQEYFSDGLTEEILNALAKVEGLRVPARSSTFIFKGPAVDLRQVGRELNVGSVLEGSVRKSGDRLKVTVRLVEVASGYELWSETYERRIDDVFEVQDDIARSVVAALRGELMAREPLVHSTTEDVEAYNLYLRGRYHWHQRTPAGFQAAISFFQQAVARDSTYALAYTGLADVYSLLGAYDYGVLPPLEAMPRAKAAAQRALALDPRLAEAHASLANIQATFDWDWPAAERGFRRALELNPGYASAHHWHSLFLHSQERTGEARSAILRARELDPLSLVMSTSLARHFYYAGDFERSVEEYRRAIEMDPRFVVAHLGKGMALVQLGRTDEAVTAFRTALQITGGAQPVVQALIAHAQASAGDEASAREALRSLMQLSRSAYVPAEYIALVHLGLGDTDAVFEWLDVAFANRSGAMAFLRVEPLLHPVRSDRRFAALLRRVGHRTGSGRRRKSA